MASLVNITGEIRTILKIVAIAAVAIASMYFIFVGGTFIKNTFFPAPAEPPEMGFGELPEINFPAQPPKEYEFVINTTSGKLPSFPDRMTVYKTVPAEPSLIALQETRRKVANAGFELGEFKVSETIYQWSNKFGDRIEIDILSGNFKITSNFINNAPPPNIAGVITEKENVFSYVVGMLATMGIDTGDLNLEKSRFLLLRLENGEVKEATSESDANLVRLDVLQNPITLENPDRTYGIYYPGFTESTMHFVLRNEGAGQRIVDASFVHNIPDLKNGSTYPIKTAEEAFQDLQDGNAIFKSNKEDGSSIDITDLGLGYYLGEPEQQYLLPIIIFQGPDFVAFVKATR